MTYSPSSFDLASLQAALPMPTDCVAQPSYRYSYSYTPPPAPRQRLRRLPSPSHSSSHSSFPSPPQQPLFPIDTTKSDDAWKMHHLATWIIPPFTPIYICDPSRQQIGVIDPIRTACTGATIVQLLKRRVRSPLSLADYVQLSDDMRRGVKRAFRDRCKSTRWSWTDEEIEQRWQDFRHGVESSDGPRGEDLLLGHTLIWGIHPAAGSHQWTIHVDRPNHTG